MLLFLPQPSPAQPGFANLELAIGELWPALNASGPADALWWTPAELYEWMDEGAKRLARMTGAFVERNTSLNSSATIPTYALPAAHITTLQADLANVTLKARSTQDLEAEDSAWASRTGDPKAFTLDVSGFNRLRLYPAPADGPNDIGLFMSRIPEEITAAQSALAAPPIIRDYFTLYALREARRKESPGSMEEIVPFLDSVLETIESAVGQLWGTK